MTISLNAELLGAQRPRIHSVPKYSSSAGQEAIDLARSAGLYLDPWQQLVLTDALGERPDGKYAAFEVGLIVPRQNGKGSVLEARELFGLVLGGEKLILHSAHLFQTSLEAFRRILRLFQETPDLDRKLKRVSLATGSEGIELTNGCRLKFVARTKGSGRGLTGDVVVLDEAYELTQGQMDALLPTLMARPNPQVWYTSSPSLDAVSGEALFKLKARGEAGSDAKLAWFDWGQERGVNLDDPRVHAAANPAYGIRMTGENVEVMRRALSDDGFGREVLGIWPETAGEQHISPALWRELADPDAGRPADVVFTIDVTPGRDHASITMCGMNPDGQMLVGVVDRREGTEWVVDRTIELKQQWNPIAIGIDAAGPSGSLLVELEQAGITRPEDPEAPKRGDLAVPTSREVAQAWGMFVDAARQKRLRHLDDAPLNAALAGAKTRFLADGQAWARRTSTVDISPLVAATLAYWAHAVRVDAIVEEPPDPSAFYINI